MISLNSNYFGTLEISGEQEKSAADWLFNELNNTTKAKEILAINEASKIYNVIVHVTNSHVQESVRTIHCLL